jgi:hypothetical protein
MDTVADIPSRARHGRRLERRAARARAGSPLHLERAHCIAAAVGHDEGLGLIIELFG